MCSASSCLSSNPPWSAPIATVCIKKRETSPPPRSSRIYGSIVNRANWAVKRDDDVYSGKTTGYEPLAFKTVLLGAEPNAFTSHQNRGRNRDDSGCRVTVFRPCPGSASLGRAEGTTSFAIVRRGSTNTLLFDRLRRE